MKKILVLMLVLLSLGINAFAAGDLTVTGNAAVNGNATVNGNLGVGTATPQSKVDINGSIRINGITFGAVYYANLGEDIYTSGIINGGTDSCNGDVGGQYECSPAEEKEPCNDVYAGGSPPVTVYYHRTVTCHVNGYLTIR